MISLMTTDRTSGPALVEPRVLAFCATKCSMLGAGEVTSKGHSIHLRRKLIAVHVTGQIGLGVAGEEIDLVPHRAEGESRRRTVGQIEFVLRENLESAGSDLGAVRNAEFLWLVEVIRQKPAADVCFIGGEIVQLDGIDDRPIGVCQRFVNDHHRKRQRRRLRLAGRTIRRAAGPPTLFPVPR